MPARLASRRAAENARFKLPCGERSCLSSGGTLDAPRSCCGTGEVLDRDLSICLQQLARAPAAAALMRAGASMRVALALVLLLAGEREAQLCTCWQLVKALSLRCRCAAGTPRPLAGGAILCSCLAVLAIGLYAEAMLNGPACRPGSSTGLQLLLRGACSRMRPEGLVGALWLVACGCRQAKAHSGIPALSTGHSWRTQYSEPQTNDP